MTVFFTSDTHFGHAAVIHNCNRPFASTEEMDEAMIAAWNARVGPRDRVYHLGDFSMSRKRGADWYLDRLNGEVHLVEGNHDRHILPRHARRFASVGQIVELTFGEQMIVLCHYPMREWNASYRGTWHLHGHVHGRLNHVPHGHSMDVGVDSNDFRPWALDEVAEVLGERAVPFDPKRPPVKKTIREPSSPGNP